MKFFASLFLMCIFLPIIFLVVFTPEPCEHEEQGKMFAFQFENSTAASYIKPFCDDCYDYFEPKSFRGTPEDTSYLEVVKEYTGEDEILGGGYYTMKAIITLADYDTQKVRINCRIESEDVIVGFSVEFREEFEESVSLLTEGDEITFRGRLYDNGFGFTDAELINTGDTTE